MSNPTLAAQTLQRASQALRDSRCAGLPEIVELVNTLSEKAQEISVQELAQVVEKDAAVLSKILSLANAFGYNPTRVPISTVSSAIQVIGFERIRMLAISLLLFEQTTRTQTNEERREAAASALFSGCLAKTAADKRPPLDAEEAFVCASLRHFGRIVLTTFMTDEYREARKMTDGMSEDDSFKQVFGLTSLELGYELLRAEHLPPEILSALKHFKPEKVQSAEAPAVLRLALSDFSTQMCALVFDSNLGEEEFEKQYQALAKRFSKVLPGIAQEIPALLSQTETYLTRFCEGLGSNIIPKDYIRNLQHRLARTDPPKPVATPAPESGAKAAAKAEVQGVEKKETPLQAARRKAANPQQPKIADLEQALANPSVPEETLNGLVLSMLSFALEAPECILFLPTSGPKSALHVAKGLGSVWLALRNTAIISPGERTALGLCLLRRENVLIHNAREQTLQQHIPAWLTQHGGLAAYVLIPILDRRGHQGLVLAGWPEPRRIAISPECAELIHGINRMLPRK